MKKNQIILAGGIVAAIWFLFFRKGATGLTNTPLGGIFAPKGGSTIADRALPGSGAGGGGLFGGGGGSGSGASLGGIGDLLKGLASLLKPAADLFKSSPVKPSPQTPFDPSVFRPGGPDISGGDITDEFGHVIGGTSLSDFYSGNFLGAPGKVDEFGNSVEFPAANGGPGYTPGSPDPLNPLLPENGNGYSAFFNPGGSGAGGSFYQSGPAPATFDAYQPAPAYQFFNPPSTPTYQTLPADNFYYGGGAVDLNNGGLYGGQVPELNPLIPSFGGE